MSGRPPSASTSQGSYSTSPLKDWQCTFIASMAALTSLSRTSEMGSYRWLKNSACAQDVRFHHQPTALHPRDTKIHEVLMGACLRIPHHCPKIDKCATTPCNRVHPQRPEQDACMQPGPGRKHAASHDASAGGCALPGRPSPARAAPARCASPSSACTLWTCPARAGPRRTPSGSGAATSGSSALAGSGPPPRAPRHTPAPGPHPSTPRAIRAPQAGFPNAQLPLSPPVALAGMISRHVWLHTQRTDQGMTRSAEKYNPGSLFLTWITQMGDVCTSCLHAVLTGFSLAALVSWSPDYSL